MELNVLLESPFFYVLHLVLRDPEMVANRENGVDRREGQKSHQLPTYSHYCDTYWEDTDGRSCQPVSQRIFVMSEEWCLAP